MIFEEVVNSVLRRYHITESMEQGSGPAIVKRLHELLDQTPQRILLSLRMPGSPRPESGL